MLDREELVFKCEALEAGPVVDGEGISNEADYNSCNEDAHDFPVVNVLGTCQEYQDKPQIPYGLQYQEDNEGSRSALVEGEVKSAFEGQDQNNQEEDNRGKRHE